MVELDTLQSHPVFGEDFFDRKDLTAHILKRSQALKDGYRQKIAIIGPCLIGKSSAAVNLLHGLKDKEIIPIYIEMKDEQFELFAKNYMSSLLRHYLRAESKEDDFTFAQLLERCRELIPKTTEAIERAMELSIRADARALNAVLDLPDILWEETKRFCIVILDEFHNFEKFGVSNPFAVIGRKIMIQKNTLYIIISSNVALARQILADKLHLLFGNFEIVELEGFDIETSRNFLAWRLCESTSSNSAADFISILTGGNPFYLDIISAELKELGQAKGKSPFDEMILADVFEKLLSSSRGVLNGYFTSLITQLPKTRKIDSAELLLRISQGFKKSHEIAGMLQCETKDITKALSALSEVGLAARCGTFYVIPDKMLKLWLRTVYRRKDGGLLNDPEENRRIFRDEFKKFSHSFISKAAPVEHIVELMKGFDNETVQLREKIYRLTRFSRIETESFGRDAKYVMACGSKYWVCSVFQREATENDVVSFNARCRAFSGAISKKVLFLLNGIDECARLVTKQEKIMIVDLENLNLLSELYDKPFYVN